jgi:hypothetical protein
MPIPLDIRRIVEGDGIEAVFIKNEAQYHESCRLMFNNTTLQRVQKRHDMPHDTLALVPQHLLRLILPKVFDLASSVHTDGVLC